MCKSFLSSKINETKVKKTNEIGLEDYPSADFAIGYINYN